MENLTNLANIGKSLAKKLNEVGITSYEELKETGSRHAAMKIATLENSGICINMLYALEGAIQGKRWHYLDKEQREELKSFFKMIE